MEVKELVRKYGLSLTLTKKVCEYFKSEDEINEVLIELSHSNLITDSKTSLFDIYLEIIQKEEKMDSEDKKKELVREFFNSGYTFEDFLNEAMEQEHITSADIIHASDIYDAPPENDMTEKEECIEAIKDAFDKIWFAHNDEVTVWQKRQYLPDERSIIEIITDYYDSDDLLDYFEDSDMLDALDGSYALKKHDEEVADDAKEDVIDDIVIELEREEIVREFLEKTPDEWWSFLCDIFGCTYYDKEAFETGFSELKEKLEKSNYCKMAERYG